MGLVYGGAGCLTTKNGGFWPGQLGTDDEDDEEDSHLLRTVDNACEVLFTRVNEIESSFENKLDQLLETLRDQARPASSSSSPRAKQA